MKMDKSKIKITPANMARRMISVILQSRMGIHTLHSRGIELVKLQSCIEHSADIEAMMPKLWHSNYYIEPRIQELAAKERAELRYCRCVKDFVVGRHGYGSIKFLGETDVRWLNLESLIQFNNREVCVYMNDSTKLPLGQGLNQPAEVTLLNIKCYDKKAGWLYTEGPEVEKYKAMLKKKAEDQGTEYLSYDPVVGKWKFWVDHF